MSGSDKIEFRAFEAVKFVTPRDRNFTEITLKLLTIFGPTRGPLEALAHASGRLS